MSEAIVDPGETAPAAGTIRIEWAALAEPYARLRVHDAVAESKLAGALAQQGQRCAALVVAARPPTAGRARYVLVDGYRRARLLRRLGYDAILAMVVALEEAEALAYCHRQETSRELVETHGMSPTEVSVSLGRTRSWVSRRLGLMRGLPAEVEEAVRRGTVPPHAAMKSLLPLARANGEACAKLVVALGTERLTTRQAAILYDAWRRGDAQTRARIVQAPRMLLAAAEATMPGEAKEPRREDETGRLAKDLGTAAALVWRAKKTLERALIVDRWVRKDDAVVLGLRRVTDAYAALARRMEDGGQDAH